MNDTDDTDLAAILAMSDEELDAHLRSLGIDPDELRKRAEVFIDSLFAADSASPPVDMIDAPDDDS